MDARQFARRGRIDASNKGMRVWAPHECSLEHLRNVQIVDEPPLTLKQRSIFDAKTPLTNLSWLCHTVALPDCQLISVLPGCYFR
jgi:hypothetical protein